MPIETIYDESYESFKGRSRMPPLEVAFWPGEAPITCIHANVTVGLVTDRAGEEMVGVYAAYVKGEPTGIYSHMTAEDCRSQAAAYLRMAEFIDERNGVKENRQ
jgi:hypothetical protein